MRTLTEQQMIDIIWGATLMGGGGGGSISSGMDLLNAYKRDHPDAKIEVDLITVDEMKGGYAAATAGMGAPAAIVGVDFSKYAAKCLLPAAGGRRRATERICDITSLWSWEDSVFSSRCCCP